MLSKDQHNLLDSLSKENILYSSLNKKDRRIYRELKRTGYANSIIDMDYNPLIPKFIKITEKGFAYLDNEKQKTFRYWIPVFISIVALLLSIIAIVVSVYSV